MPPICAPRNANSGSASTSLIWTIRPSATRPANGRAAPCRNRMFLHEFDESQANIPKLCDLTIMVSGLLS